MPVLYIIRGLPGSGKSTIATDLIDLGSVDVHFEADMYHMIDGEYKWKPENVKPSHDWCFNQTVKNLHLGRSVVVSNTFTTWKEVAPYVNLAHELNVELKIITCLGNYGNVHSVPEETMKKMAARFESQFTWTY